MVLQHWAPGNSFRRGGTCLLSRYCQDPTEKFVIKLRHQTSLQIRPQLKPPLPPPTECESLGRFRQGACGEDFRQLRPGGGSGFCSIHPCDPGQQNCSHTAHEATMWNKPRRTDVNSDES